MHEVYTHRVKFNCDKYNMSLTTESNKKNHKKVFGGIATDNPDQRKCFNISINKSNIASNAAGQRQQVTETVASLLEQHQALRQLQQNFIFYKYGLTPKKVQNTRRGEVLPVLTALSRS